MKKDPGRKGASIAVPREAGYISGTVSCGLLFSLQAHAPLMGLGFGNPLLYANQSQLARRQRWCGRSWHVSSTLSFSANVQLHWL